jgi:hypothetical protein
MHQGLSYNVLDRLSGRLKQLEDSDQNPYHVCWEQSSALCGALEQDLRYMGGGQGWPCIVELNFALKDTQGDGMDSFRAIVKYPGRFEEDIRVVVTGLIHQGRIDVKVRNIVGLEQKQTARFHALLKASSEDEVDLPVNAEGVKDMA